MKIYSDMAGVRYGGGFGSDGPLPSITHSTYANSQLLSEACFLYCRTHHDHDEEDYKIFRERPALRLPVRPEEYIMIPPPQVPARSTSSPTPSPEPEPTPLAARPRAVELKTPQLQDTGTLPAIIKAKRPTQVAPAPERLQAPPVEAAIQEKPPSRRQPPRSVNAPMAALVDEAHAAAAPDAVRKRKTGDTAWFVLSNGEIFTDSAAAESEMHRRGLARLKIVSSLEEARQWLLEHTK
ncbi:hypothetical protein DFH09DRAFT_1349650 [Mycena vulgaris]|nr:hypothetical protein DFH09DRAFT_1349650 [Mycena vulgaris]